MPFDFDLEEESPETREQAASDKAQTEQQLYGAIDASDDLVDEFTEAEKRFEKAQFYRTILRQGLFEESSSTSEEVESELRTFIRERLNVLLGITSEPKKQEAQFTDDEARVLKEVASKLGAKTPAQKASPPKLRTVGTTPAPQAKQIAKQPSAPKLKPVMNAQPKPVPAPAPAAPAPKSTKTAEKGKPGRKKVKKTGETMKVDGVDYTKVVDADGNEFYINKEGQQFRIGNNEAGQLFMRNITVQALPSGAAGAAVTAPLSKAMYEAQYAAAASQTIRAAENNPILNTILGNM